MSVSILPIVILPLTFLFVLLIILICKVPKVGAWVVGGLLLLTPAILLGLARDGALAHEEALPLFIIPATFLFVLLVILLAKAPRAGIAMIVAVVVMVVGGGIAVMTFSHSRDGYVPQAAAYLPQQTVANNGIAIVDHERVYEDCVDHSVTSSSPSEPLSPIWSEGVEQELEADVYPSALAAARALGRRMAGPIHAVTGDPNTPIKVVLFQENNDRGLVTEFGYAMGKSIPGVQYSIEADLRNINPGEVGLVLRREQKTHEEQLRNEDTPLTRVGTAEGGRIAGTVFDGDKRDGAEVGYIDKPWVENFGAFVGAAGPNHQYIIARSNGSCMSEAEAHQQALEDAQARVAQSVGERWRWEPAALSPGISTTDVLNGGFVMDRFVQSFDGAAGKIWRQAVLLDVSGSKLMNLIQQKAMEVRETRMTWARMGLSVVGTLVLIGVIYFFLNMATRGYYEWSLRIAGVILAVVAVVAILMIVH